MKKNVLIILAIILCFFNSVSARLDTGGEFLTIGSGSRAAGMGEAFTSVAGDINCVNYNPAGLALLKKKQLTLEHNPLIIESFNDMSYNFIAGALPTKKFGTFAVSLIYLQSGEHVITDKNGKETGHFKTRDQAITLSYANKLSNNVFYGINLKTFKTKFYYVLNSTYAADAGLIFLPIKGLSFGLAVKNHGNSIYYVDEYQEDKLPESYNFGFNFLLYKNFIFSADISKPLSQSDINYNIGSEVNFSKIFNFRCGYFDKGGGWNGYTYGLGFSLNNISFDFANYPYGELDRSSKYAITIKMPSPKK